MEVLLGKLTSDADEIEHLKKLVDQSFRRAGQQVEIVMTDGSVRSGRLAKQNTGFTMDPPSYKGSVVLQNEHGHLTEVDLLDAELFR